MCPKHWACRHRPARRVETVTIGLSGIVGDLIEENRNAFAVVRPPNRLGQDVADVDLGRSGCSSGSAPLPSQRREILT